MLGSASLALILCADGWVRQDCGTSGTADTNIWSFHVLSIVSPGQHVQTRTYLKILFKYNSMKYTNAPTDYHQR